MLSVNMLSVIVLNKMLYLKVVFLINFSYFGVCKELLKSGSKVFKINCPGCKIFGLG